MAKMSRWNKLILCQLAVASVSIIHRFHSTMFLLDTDRDTPATYKEDRGTSNQMANQTKVSPFESTLSVEQSSSSMISLDEKLSLEIKDEESNDSQSKNILNTTFIESSSSKGFPSTTSEHQIPTSDQIPPQNQSYPKDIDDKILMKQNETETMKDETHPDENITTSILQLEEPEKQLNQSHQRTKKPIFAAHCGPNKSGSTFLQTLLANPQPRQILAQDNYRFLGKCSWKKNLFDKCLYVSIQPFTEQINSEGQKEYIIDPLLNQLVNELKQNNTNGLYIQESACAPSFIYGFQQLLSDFDVHIISTYRRMYEFLPSAYGQTIREIFNVPPSNDENLFEPIPFTYFNEEELDSIPSIYSDLFRNLVYNHADHRLKQNMDRAKDALGEDVTYTTLKFHTKHDNYPGNDLVIELFCSGAIPGTNHTCQAAKDNLIVGPTKANARIDSAYFQIAVKAYKQGLIKDPPESRIANRIQNRIKEDESYSTLPKICMSEEKLEKLHDFSWKHEQMIYPMESNLDDHRRAFHDYTKKGNFCSLDVDALLEMDEWRTKLSMMTFT